jgi:hypothetical protein
MWTKKIRSTARSAPGSTSVALPLGSSASDGCSSQLVSSGAGAAAPRGHHRRAHSESFLRFPDAELLLLDPDADFSFSDLDFPSLSDDSPVASDPTPPSQPQKAAPAPAPAPRPPGGSHTRSLSLDTGFWRTGSRRRGPRRGRSNIQANWRGRSRLCRPRLLRYQHNSHFSRYRIIFAKIRFIVLLSSEFGRDWEPPVCTSDAERTLSSPLRALAPPSKASHDTDCCMALFLVACRFI